MKKAYKEIKFQEQDLKMISAANSIIVKYQAKDMRMTARQLYYRFVAQNWISNNEKSYKNLTNLLSRARLGGLVDWSAIEDRGREPLGMASYKDMASCLEGRIEAFRFDRWRDQKHYVELWVEKQALAGVLWPIARKFHVTLMVNKGYSSQTAMYESAQRLKYKMKDRPGYAKVLYLGDHDPSGEDMVRDITDRLTMFRVERLLVEKVGLTIDQVHQYKLPPNPAKVTDPRAKKYIEKHGQVSWEVDALPPDDLTEIITGRLNSLVDHTKMRVILNQEKEAKALARKVLGIPTK